MTEALAFVSIGTLCVGIVTLAVAFLGLRSARRSAELAEHRMEYLREEHDRLAFLREEHRNLEEELKRERRERMAAEQKAERAERERPAKLEQDRKLLTEELERDRLRLQQEYKQLMEELEQERAAHLESQHQIRRERSEREREKQARWKAEQKAGYLEEECKKLREAKKSGQLDRERVIEDLREASKALWKRLSAPK